MSNATNGEARSRIVLVVGLDLTDVSEHLLVTARNLVRSVDEAELHLVHVVHRESVTQRLAEPIGAVGTVDRANVEYARWELERLRDSIVLGAGARVILHTPLGHTADELARIASEVDADVIVVEAHHAGSRWGFHRSVIARIAKIAACSVLAVRQRPTTASRAPRRSFPAPPAAPRVAVAK
jgi:nucleotide-binding universal stress UspA family protein